MAHRAHRRAVTGTATVVVGSLLLSLAGATGVSAATAIPTHVYSPYFETRTTDSITTTANHV
jgi:hypothetical protein